MGEQLRIHAARSVRRMTGQLLLKEHENGTILAVQDDFMLVQCGQGLLAVTEVQVPGRRPVAARDFSHSRALPGRRLG